MTRRRLFQALVALVPGLALAGRAAAAPARTFRLSLRIPPIITAEGRGQYGPSHVTVYVLGGPQVTGDVHRWSFEELSDGTTMVSAEGLTEGEA